jgi:ATP-dependent Lhr-like helicase
MPRPRAPRARETEASSEAPSDPLGAFHEATRRWFASTLGAPTPIQARAFPVLATHASALLLAPTGSGKTLAAFLAALDHLMFRADALGATLGAEPPGVEVLYLSPLKALGADVERNLARPARWARAHGRGRRLRVSRAHRRSAHGRHARARAGRALAQAPVDPHHDPRVALPAAHLCRASEPDARAHRDRRRDPHHGRDEARRPPLHEPRAPRRAARARARAGAAAAHRALGHAETARARGEGARGPRARARRAPRRARRPAHAAAPGAGARGSLEEGPRALGRAARAAAGRAPRGGGAGRAWSARRSREPVAGHPRAPRRARSAPTAPR